MSTALEKNDGHLDFADRLAVWGGRVGFLLMLAGALEIYYASETLPVGLYHAPEVGTDLTRAIDNTAISGVFTMGLGLMLALCSVTKRRTIRDVRDMV